MKKQSGLTLFEVLIVLGISTVIGSILIASLINFQGLFSQSTTQSFQGISINDAVVKISDTIKQSNAVVSTTTINSTTYSSSSQSIVLQYPSLDSQGGIISQKYDYIVISRDPQKNDILKKYVFPDPLSNRKASEQVLTTGLSQILFTYFDQLNNSVSPAGAVRVAFSINLNEKSGFDFKTSSASGKANLKNQ